MESLIDRVLNRSVLKSVTAFVRGKSRAGVRPDCNDRDTSNFSVSPFSGATGDQLSEDRSLRNKIPNNSAQDADQQIGDTSSERHSDMSCENNEQYLSGNKVSSIDLKCQSKIAHYSARLRDIDTQELDIILMDKRFRDLLVESTDEAEQASHLQSLDDIQEPFDQCRQERSSRNEKPQYWRGEMTLPETTMFRDLKEVLETNHLLEEDSDSESGVQGDTMDYEAQESHRNESDLSLSELERQELEVEREAVKQYVKDSHFRLQDARDKVENWKTYCNKQYEQFQEIQAVGRMEDSKTELDIRLVKEGQKATREYIEAEEALSGANRYAREFGVVLDPMDQTSDFFDRNDDGYVESMDIEAIANVDRGRVQKWMEQERGSPTLPATSDEWECQTVDVSDSVSVVMEQVATGRDRKRIDRWRSMCEMLKAETNGEEKDN
ncbi:uncharacterized protein PAC_17743 [Phialocephala subalpina]|uniref:EF-hand domain-containing protein n=1 Tax=Phialocephala subalpina TaxID=576137 RepID=A0A1L7XS20_9HELO|nr:uncharacterized protein PAC_17743 [Phialocephala subalpina]